MAKRDPDWRKKQLQKRLYILLGAVIAVLAVILLIVNIVNRRSGGSASSATAAEGPLGEITEDVVLSTAQPAEAGAASATTGAENNAAENAAAASAAAGATTDAAATGAASGTTTDAASISAGTTAPAGPVKLTVTATGDVTIGIDDSFDYDTSFNGTYYDVEDPDWFFENLADIFKADDLTIINFEGVLSEQGEREDKQYAFRGDPIFAKVLTGVDAANLANNHSFDYGRDAYEDTKQILADAGITTFGYDRSMVIDVNGIKVGLTGTLALYDEWDAKDGMVEQIEWVKQQGAQLVISSVHWGDEGEYHQADWQEYLGHAAVDAGADLVIGHHPHRLQPYETYKGKHILYSLGNFCFGGHRSPSDMDCAVWQETFTFENGVLTGDDYNIIPCSISSASDYNNYQPTPLEGDAAERALGKIPEL